MKRSIWVCIVATMILPAATLAATLTFNGSDIVADWALPSVTVGTPVAGDGYIGTTSGAIRTYDNGTDAPNPAAFNTWLGTLGAGKGLSGFNLWLQDGLSNQAGLWGETVALADPKTSAENITPFASAGWTASVYTMGSEWGATWVGSQFIHYEAIGSANYLRPGSTAMFGFTADVVGFNGTGPKYQMWVGAGTAANSDVGVNQLAGVDGGVYFQRAVTATAVPLPAAAWMGISLIGGLGGVRGIKNRLRRQKA